MIIPAGTTGNLKLYAEWTMGNSVQITRPENGTITVMSGTTEVKSGDKVGANTSLTITATPASADYKLSKLVVNNTEYTTSSQTVKMPAEGGLTISAAFADPRPAASAPKITTDPVNTDYIPSGESVTVTMDKGGECDSLLYSIDGLYPETLYRSFPGKHHYGCHENGCRASHSPQVRLQGWRYDPQHHVPFRKDHYYVQPAERNYGLQSRRG